MLETGGNRLVGTVPFGLGDLDDLRVIDICKSNLFELICRHKALYNY